MEGARCESGMNAKRQKTYHDYLEHSGGGGDIMGLPFSASYTVHGNTEDIGMPSTEPDSTSFHNSTVKGSLTIDHEDSQGGAFSKRYVITIPCGCNVPTSSVEDCAKYYTEICEDTKDGIPVMGFDMMGNFLAIHRKHNICKSCNLSFQEHLQCQQSGCETMMPELMLCTRQVQRCRNTAFCPKCFLPRRQKCEKCFTLFGRN